ncbi:uncharacterized protein CLUP02_01762 [Colletotrichum lupini]|uniref:Uncharacterized protein n=1 Tax=Colletotrichum lupini TaxID=145971 RepID=A0A9Q8SD04_9PEZI|nr:uncharacterized protein CLUP02_01762 [Colletotrichum lupini]UQC75109.1 hypothetical protein CLUP02_01762 [Colletotrichum lupini]
MANFGTRMVTTTMAMNHSQLLRVHSISTRAVHRQPPACCLMLKPSSSIHAYIYSLTQTAETRLNQSSWNIQRQQTVRTPDSHGCSPRNDAARRPVLRARDSNGQGQTPPLRPTPTPPPSSCVKCPRCLNSQLLVGDASPVSVKAMFARRLVYAHTAHPQFTQPSALFATRQGPSLRFKTGSKTGDTPAATTRPYGPWESPTLYVQLWEPPYRGFLPLTRQATAGSPFVAAWDGLTLDEESFNASASFCLLGHAKLQSSYIDTFPSFHYAWHQFISYSYSYTSR